MSDVRQPQSTNSASPSAQASTGAAPNRPTLNGLFAASSFGGNGGTKPTPIVPHQSVSSRTLMMLIAIMTFLMCITLGAVILIQKSALEWSASVGREATIQIRPTANFRMDDALPAAERIARQSPGIGRVTILAEEESLALLEPWLGSGLDLSALRVPRIISVEFSNAALVDLDAMRAALSEIPGASLDAHTAWQEQLNAMSGTMVITGILVLLLIVSATILAIIFATRGTMASNRSIVDVLHFIGASNGFIAQQFQTRFLTIGLNGGAIGSAAAILFFFVISLIIGGFAPANAGAQVSAVLGGLSIGWEGLFALLLVIPFIAVLTAITSRMTVGSFLTQIS